MSSYSQFGGSRSSGAEVLDMTTAIRSEWQWQRITCTGIKRDRYAAACVEGNIYVVSLVPLLIKMRVFRVFTVKCEFYYDL